MTNPIGITGKDANRFNLKINPKYGKNFHANTAQGCGDLRDRYSVEASAKRMGFRSMDEYQQFMWESHMKRDAVQQAADQQAINDTVNGIGAIAKGVANIFSMF